MDYYVYENWQAGPHKARIHISSCRFCNNGKGIHNTDSEEHGKWHGPFLTYEETLQAAIKTGGEVTECQNCCKNQIPNKVITDKTHIEISPIILKWSDWYPWDQLILDVRTEANSVKIPSKPGVYEAKLVTSNTFLTIGKASDLRMRVRQGLIKGKVPHSSGEKIRMAEDLSQIHIRWAETNRPACVEEELHKRYVAEHGVLPKYTQRT